MHRDGCLDGQNTRDLRNPRGGVRVRNMQHCVVTLTVRSSKFHTFIINTGTFDIAYVIGALYLNPSPSGPTVFLQQ